MTYKLDPGGQFASDTHRRVLGHLSVPGDKFGYTPEQLFIRMLPDTGTKLVDASETQEILWDLQKEGLAEEAETGVFRMTEAGHDLLSGPASDEVVNALAEQEAGPAPITIIDEPTPRQKRGKSKS